MNNKKLIIAIVLCIMAVISLIYGMRAAPKGERQAAPISEVSSQDEAVPTAPRIIPIKRRAAKTNFNFWGRNPFVQEETAVKAVEKFTLNGIMWDEKKPLAIINNDVVGIGDKVGESRIVGITKESVILNDGTRNFELRLTE